MAVAKTALRIRIAFLCCFLIPFHSFPMIHFYAIAIIIAITKQILCICSTLL